MNLTDKDIADLLDEVTEQLAKSATLSKEVPAEIPQEAPVEQPAPEQAPAPEMAPAQDAAPAPEAAPANPEQQIEGEQADQPLTDEELHQVYASMDPQELERHFAVVRDVIQQTYGQAGEEQMEGEQAPQAPEQAAPEAEQAPQAPEQAPEQQPEAQPEQEMQPDEAMKSESFIKLKKENDEIKKSLASLTKVIETMTKPQRKSATLIKNEVVLEPMQKSEVKLEISKLVRDPSLKKSERQFINNFLYTGADQEKVEEIIKSRRK